MIRIVPVLFVVAVALGQAPSVRPLVIPVACECKAGDEACRHRNCAGGLGSINGTGASGTTSIQRPDDTIQQGAQGNGTKRPDIQ
jgi:hypothetical protein